MRPRQQLMRILQLPTNFRPGGIQRHVLDLSAYLAGQGHELVLAGDHGAWEPPSPQYVHVPLGRVAETGGSTLQRLAALVPTARAIRSIVRKRRIQIIHAHETAPALAARIATLGLGIPIVFTFHGAAPAREVEVARIARLTADITLSRQRSAPPPNVATR
jgi:glycosyltransferase involved in cell wall biosynthesis